MKRNYTIDLFRLVASFVLICLHTEYGKLNVSYVDNIRLVARWGLPFFFITSGYFLGSKIHNQHFSIQLVEKNITHLISILLVASIVYLPLDILSHHTSLNHISILFTGTSFHLWFLGSLLFGYIFIWYFYSLQWIVVLNVISIIILIFCLFTNSYSLLFESRLSSELGQFLLCIPLMNIGILIERKKASAKYLPFLILLIGAGFFVQFAEADFFFKHYSYSRHDQQFLIGTLLTSVALFITAILIPIRKNILSVWGHKYSLFIYLYHIAVLFVVNSLVKHLFHSEYDTIEMFYPLILFVFTLLTAIVLDNYFPFVFKCLNGNCNELSGRQRKNKNTAIVDNKLVD